MKQGRAEGTPLQKDQQSEKQQLGLSQGLPLSLTCHSLGCYLSFIVAPTMIKLISNTSVASDEGLCVGHAAPTRSRSSKFRQPAVSYDSWIAVCPCNMASLCMCTVPGRQWRLWGCSQDLCLLHCPWLTVPWEGMRGWMKQQGAPRFVLEKCWESRCEWSCGLSGEKELLSVRAAEPPRERAHLCLCPRVPSREPEGWVAGWHLPGSSLHVPHFPGALPGVVSAETQDRDGRKPRSPQTQFPPPAGSHRLGCPVVYQTVL